MSRSRPFSLQNRALWVYGLAALAVTLACLTALPSFVAQSPNSGVFAYAGTVLLDGGVLYRDVWDNKPPVVFFLNTLAFLIFGPTRGALWVLDAAAFLVTILLLVWLLLAYHRRLIWPILGALLFVITSRHPSLIEGGNYTEGYALIFQVGCLVAGYRFLVSPSDRWAVLIGLSSAPAFLTKQTTIGVALAFIPAMLISRHPVVTDSRRWRWLLIIIAAGLTPLLITAGILAMQGLISTAYDALFVSPGALHHWISGEPTPIWRTVGTTLSATVGGFYVLTALPVLLLALFHAVRGESEAAEDDSRRALRLWLMLALLADLLLINLSDRGYGHYYLTMLPAFVFLLTISLDVLSTMPRQPRSRRLLPFTASVYLFIVFGFVFGATTFVSMGSANGYRSSGGPIMHPAWAAVSRVVEPGDYLLVWGATSTLNFQTATRSPMRYATAYPVISPGYTERLVAEIMAELDAKKPLVIADTTRLDGDRIPPLDAESRQEWWAEGGRRDIEGLEPLYDYVAANCQLDTVTLDDVYIYVCP